MLSKQKSATTALSKYALLVPFLCGLFFSFDTPAFAQQTQTRRIDVNRVLKAKTIDDVATVLGLSPSDHILSFEMTVRRPERDPQTMSCKDGIINPAIERNLQAAAANDTYYFDNVVIQNGSATRTLSSTLKLVEVEYFTTQVDVHKFANLHNNSDIITVLGLPSDTEIQNFELTFLKKDSDPTTTQSTNANAVSALFKKANAGDTYYFDDFVVKEGGNLRYWAFKCIVVE